MSATKNQPSSKGARMKPSQPLRMYQLQSPEIARTMAELRAKFGKYALPDSEARKIVDKAMGGRTLTEELFAMREG